MKHLSNLLYAGMSLLVLSSCSLFGGAASKKSKAPAVLPQDRQILVKNVEKTYTPEEIRKGVVKGDWSIESVYGKKTVGMQAPFIKFVPAEKRIYGNNGCNVINAVYNVNPADSTMSFDQLASTMRMCDKDGLTDYEINTALGAAKYYTWRIVDTEYYITCYDENHQQIMELMHQNFQFLNGTWVVTRINDEAVDIPEMKLVIDVDEGKIHGNTGCNVINGNMEIDMEAANSISFSAIGMTQALCHDSKYETALIVALEDVSAAKPVSGTEVILYSAQHKPVLTLKRPI